MVSGAQASTVRHSVTDDQSDDNFSFDLPGTVTGKVVDTAGVPANLLHGVGNAMGSTEVGGSVLSTFETADGMQTLISVPSANAPQEYRFQVALPAGIKAAGFRDGGIAFVDDNASAVGALRPPWAFDARGAAVKTFFRADGQVAVLSLRVTPDMVFPVVAGIDEAVQEDVNHSQPIDPGTGL
ncbi:conserved hypothetical protein [Leifsonia xyli subsp. xyli str. CTCB07]|uniref:Uncharacterized protein n=3 Tax=Leifsonia xyli TaxID=1575 RepID=Q6AER5_LEIXX|nr:conserved hypothetical protein [Leifsonia xyli subsp. xyli str. CTCB07]